MEFKTFSGKANHILPFFWVRGETEAVIRTEIEKVQECGIREICVEGRPFEDFAGPAWWSELDIILDECRKRGMRIWILDDKHFPTGYANGIIEKKYPERKKEYLNYNSLDVAGKSRRLTIDVREMMKPCTGWWELDKPFDKEERERNVLLAIIAAKLFEDDVLFEETLDLTAAYDGRFAEVSLPDGNWRIMVFYTTRTDGGDPAYINMLDRESAYSQIEAVYAPHYARYPDEFGKTIAGFFSDEPQMGNLSEITFDAKLGKKRMPLPWSSELREILEAKYGKEAAGNLPFLFFQTKEACRGTQARFEYMDALTGLYKKSFSEALGNWCEAHHVEYIGHVVEDNNLHSRLGMGAGHYFRAMSGQHMAGVDTIGDQIVFGAPKTERNARILSDGEFFHFALAKMGSSCAHLDPKKKGRAMCELFGAYGWSFGVRDMKYVLDHVLTKGINYLVPHAFSMAEYPDPDCPPHFYARGNNPEYSAFAGLMKYGERMCSLLSEGRHIASVLVLYDAEGDWTGGAFMPMQKVCRELIENQIDFDIVSLDVLADLQSFDGAIENGSIRINGEVFYGLIVPYLEHAPRKLQEFLTGSGSLPVWFADAKPSDIIGEDCDAGDLHGKTVKLGELGETLRAEGIFDISVDTEFKDLSFYHYYKGRNIYVFFNESAEQAFEGAVVLPGTTEVICYDAYDDRYEKMQCDNKDDSAFVRLCLEAGESIVLVEKKGQDETEKIHRTCKEIISMSNELDISENWFVSLAGAKDYPEFGPGSHAAVLEPVSDRLPAFSGFIRYEKEIEINSDLEEAYIVAENVYEVMSVWINGRFAGEKITPPYVQDISSCLEKGKNRIWIEVATTCARDQLNFPEGPVKTSFHALEPNGMFGRIIIKYR